MIVETRVLGPQLVTASDDLLGLSRRLDWRFVFANPVLGHVIVAGDPDPELLDALQEFSENVSLWRGSTVDNCELLILCNPSRALLQETLRILSPRRFYVEFDRTSLRHRLQRALCLRDLSVLTRRDHYESVCAFWYWPQIANANRLISLSASEPMSFVLVNAEAGWRGRLLAAGLDVLRRIGLLALLVNGLGVAGERRI